MSNNTPSGDQSPGRFRCYNCAPPHEFSSALPACPRCGADDRRPGEHGVIFRIETIHFNPPHRVIRDRTQRVMACTGASWPPETSVSSETLVVTCPACRETEAYRAAHCEQHPPDATDRARKYIDDQVAGLYVDQPPDLDPELANAFVAIASGIRECTRLMASIPHQWMDEAEYRRLAACVAEAATAAHAAYMAVDIRLRRVGGANPMLEALNDVLTVQGRVPLDPTGTLGGVNAILTNLYTKRAELFCRVDGRGCIDRMLDHLARVPPTTNSAPAAPVLAVPAPLLTGTRESVWEKPETNASNGVPAGSAKPRTPPIPRPEAERLVADAIANTPPDQRDKLTVRLLNEATKVSLGMFPGLESWRKLQGEKKGPVRSVPLTDAIHAVLNDPNTDATDPAEIVAEAEVLSELQSHAKTDAERSAYEAMTPGCRWQMLEQLKEQTADARRDQRRPRRERPDCS